MSRLRLFLLSIVLVILFYSIGLGQEYKLWSDGVVISATASGSNDSYQQNFTNNYKDYGTFNGLFVVILDVDSSTTASGGGDDSLYFVPMYQISGTWFTGDTIQWDRLNTAAYGIDDTFFDSNQELIIAETYHDSLMIWKVDPTSTTDVEGMPAWQNFKMRVLHGASVNFSLDVRAGRY